MAVKNLFLSVGAMKAGTTFLYEALNRHPDVFFTPEKELHYFAHTQGLSRRLQRPLRPMLGGSRQRVRRGEVLSHDFRRLRLSRVMHNRYARIEDAEIVRNIVRWYADRYLASPIDEAWLDSVFTGAEDMWCADFSNYHAQLSDDGWANVRRHCENLRVMYVMRDPVERLWSHLKFELIPSGKRQALIEGDLSEVERFLMSLSSSHGRYRDVVASLRRNLSSDELHIVRLEDIVSDLHSGIGAITDFLGISPLDTSKIDRNKKSNRTEELDIPSPVRAVLEEAVSEEIAFYRALKQSN